MRSSPPQLAVGGCTPTPRNDTPASTRIAVPTVIEAATMIGVSAFGSTWRHMRRSGGTPAERDASMNGSSRTSSTCPRMMRAKPVQPNTANEMMTL